MSAAGKAVIQATVQQHQFLSGPFMKPSGNFVNFQGGTTMVSNKMIVTFMLIAIASLASAGCSDDNPVTPANIDEAPIFPPTKLTVDLNKGKAMLKWGPSVDSRVVNYFVDREQDGVLTSLGKTDKSKTQFVDENPVVGYSTYYVYAAGTGPRKSATASVSLMITPGHRTANLHN
jgi:hypothetical protein